MQYDYVIIGGGPTGLTFALHMSRIGKKCLVIEKNPNIGGCHRVNRVNGRFAEHGPRIYSDSFINFRRFLDSDLHMDFYEIFTPYDNQITSIGKNIIKKLKTKEILSFAKEFTKLMCGSEISKSITMSNFMKSGNFCSESTDVIDQICRLTECADSTRYTLFEFLQLINSGFFYKLYTPAKPTDEQLFPRWKAKLQNNGVDIMVNAEAIRLTVNSNKIMNVVVRKNNAFEVKTGKTFIMAIPPYHIHLLLQRSNIDWLPLCKINEITYDHYIPVTFHWNTKLELKQVWGIPESDWGLITMRMDHYINENTTFISTCISLLDQPSSNNGKTANECNREELIAEMFYQLKQTYSDLPDFDEAILNPSVAKVNNKWTEGESGFILTPQGYIDNEHQYDNLYNVGPHNGNAKYHLTTIETAITNAISLFNKLDTEMSDEYKESIYAPLTLIDAIRTILTLIILIVSVVLIRKY